MSCFSAAVKESRSELFRLALVVDGFLSPFKNRFGGFVAFVWRVFKLTAYARMLLHFVFTEDFLFERSPHSREIPKVVGGRRHYIPELSTDLIFLFYSSSTFTSYIYVYRV